MDFKTDFLTGCTLEWTGEAYDGCFGIDLRDKHQGDEHYTFAEFWADTIRDVPAGAIYHDGFLIVHNEADGLALMAALEREYDAIVSEPKPHFVQNLGWC